MVTDNSHNWHKTLDVCKTATTMLYVWAPTVTVRSDEIYSSRHGDLEADLTCNTSLRSAAFHRSCLKSSSPLSLHWRHNDHDSVSNHQPHECLLNRLFRRRSKKTSKLRVTGLCVGNSPGPVNSPHKAQLREKCFHLMTSSCSAKPEGIWVSATDLPEPFINY